MRKRAPIKVAIACLLMFAAAVVAGMCVEYVFPWKTDLSRGDVDLLKPETYKYLKNFFNRRDVHRLKADTVEYLKKLDEPVSLTYVVTNRADMPSEFKRVEKGVVSVLKNMKQAAPGRSTENGIVTGVEYEVVDPSGSDALVRFTSEKKVSQYHVENILDDRKSEKVVWSSIVISMGDHRDVVMHGITEDHIPHLEHLIVGHLKNMKDPIKPTIGISMPEGSRINLEGNLSQQGTVVRVDLNEEIPGSVDMLYAIEPPEMDAGDVFRLKQFIESGRTIVLADSLYKVRAELNREGGLEGVVSPTKTGANEILSAFGLAMEEKVLMDEKCEFMTVPNRGGPVAFPPAIKSNPTAFNLKNFAGTLSGNLGFMGASVIKHDAYALKSAGYDIQTVVTSSDKVWTLPLNSMRLSESDMSPDIPKPKQPLIVLLKNKNPFYGKLLVVGSPSMFSEDGLNKAGFGHRPFLKLLGRTFLSSDALVKMRVERSPPGQISEVSPDTVLLLRFIVIVLLPALALGNMLKKTLRTSGLPGKDALIHAVAVPAMFAVAVLAIVLPGNTFERLRLDFSDGNLNSLSWFTVETIRESESEVGVELYSSSWSEMPASMKQAHAKTLDVLAQISRRSDGKINLEIINPDEMNEVDRAVFAAKGIVPSPIETTEYDIPVTKEIWHGMRIHGGGKEAVVPFVSDKNAGSLEFYIVSALKELNRGRPVDVAVASDMPRLSPAEAYEDFFKKQLSAPIGSDVYSEAKSILEEHNFRVKYVNPKTGVIPEGTDLLMWLQPRRPTENMGTALGKYLADGGSAMVALQHFNIQQRQYSGRGFQTVYWPQPQYMDLNNYLDLIGVNLVREVFMDEVQTAMALEMQINRLAVREYEDQAVAKPFLIRAIPPNYSQDSPVTSRMGDLLFKWGNRLSLDEGRMKALGLEAETLVSSSARSWSYEWSGGFLGDEVFDDREYLEGRQPLAAVVKGSFPPVMLHVPEPKIGDDGKPVSAGQPSIQLDMSQARGSGGALMLVGCSEMFKNPHIYAEGFYHKEFLLNAVTYMTMGAGAVELLSRQNVPRGFERPDGETVLNARILIMGLPPAVALVFCLVWFVARGRRKTVV
ncbi:Gldg family protein [bacterium]